VRIERIELMTAEGPVIHVKGADLMDGTPIYDIKPYLEYVDSHRDVRCGFTDTKEWQALEVVIPDDLQNLLPPSDLKALIKTLSLDPRPHYHNDEQRIYGMPFGGFDVRFRVASGKVQVLDFVIEK
jgi:hypothetical protein